MAVKRDVWEKAFQEVINDTGGNIEAGALQEAVASKIKAVTGAMNVASGTVGYWMSVLLESDKGPGGRRYYFKGQSGATPAAAPPPATVTTPTVSAPSPPTGPPEVEPPAPSEQPSPAPVPQAEPEPFTPAEEPPAPPVEVEAPSPATSEEFGIVLPPGVDLRTVRKYPPNGPDKRLRRSVWFPREESDDAYAQKWTVMWPRDESNREHPYGEVWDILVPGDKAYAEYEAQYVGTPSPTDKRVGSDLWLLQQMYESQTGKKTGGRSAPPQPCLMMGHSGTGKTHSIYAALGDPNLAANKRADGGKYPWEYPRIYRAVMSAMSPEQIIGQWIPNEFAKKGEGGRSDDPPFRWVDGVLTKMVRYGGTFIADELNMTAADVLAAVNSLLDDQHILTLTQKNGEIVPADSKFWFIGAGNPVGPGYVGVKPINIALRSRFSMVFWYTWNKAYEEKKYPPNSMVGPIRLEWVHHLFDDLRQGFLKGQLHYPVSTRDLGHFMSNLTMGAKNGAGVSPAFISLLYLFDTVSERNLVKGVIANNVPDKSVRIAFPSEGAED
jgi:AAA domain (dynein-related subfamily)